MQGGVWMEAATVRALNKMTDICRRNTGPIVTVMDTKSMWKTSGYLAAWPVPVTFSIQHRYFFEQNFQDDIDIPETDRI